ncbi:MAG: D-glycero-beta-D-manno-heptose-7-phosphate kinase, partial [Hydrogenobaculum sp.]
MSLDKKRAFEILDAFKNLKIAVVGDVMLDHYLFGNVERISPEAPVPVVEVLSEEYRLGGAANV